YQKIIFPPTGVLSPRAGAYAAVDTITNPAPDQLVFKLKYPSASFATNLASPWNFIYSAAKLKTDIHWYEKNIDGTGPFIYVPNTKVKPFDDVRVRQALTLAIDRYVGSASLQKITIVKDVGGLMRPGGPFAQADADLQKIAGYSTDAAAAKTKAKQLLADAGV